METPIKTFDNLVFENHGSFITRAYLEFDNGYGISVIYGPGTYSNYPDTFEIAMMKNGNIDLESPLGEDVIGYVAPDEITEIMEQLQNLPRK